MRWKVATDQQPARFIEDVRRSARLADGDRKLARLGTVVSLGSFFVRVLHAGVADDEFVVDRIRVLNHERHGRSYFELEMIGNETRVAQLHVDRLRRPSRRGFTTASTTCGRQRKQGRGSGPADHGRREERARITPNPPSPSGRATSQPNKDALRESFDPSADPPSSLDDSSDWAP